MTLDNSYIGPYLEDWLKYVRESNSAEQQLIKNGTEFCVPYAGVPSQMVRVIFLVCGRCKIEAHAKYLAVHLLDRFLGRLFWELASAHPEPTQPAGLQHVRDKLSGQVKLALAVCLQIASKVDLFSTGLGISQVQELLRLMDPDREYSKTAVSSYELRVLKSLDFRLPHCLPIHALEVFLAHEQLADRPLIRETCLRLLDLAYLRHEELFGQLHLMAHGRKYDKSRPNAKGFLCLEASAPFLAAAVLICSNFFLHLPRDLVDSLSAKLARIIDSSPVDLVIMANILFTHAIDESDFKSIQQDAQAQIKSAKSSTVTATSSKTDS